MHKKRRLTRGVSYFLQGLLAGLVVLCVVIIYQQTEGSFSLTETGRSFENTGLFLQTVEEIVREKIRCDQNKDLFETSGDYEPGKLIDIRQYTTGLYSQVSQNPATSYTLEDLISFGQDGAAAMQMAVDRALSGTNTEEAAGQALAAQASTLEKVLPQSGNYLADEAKSSANAYLTVLEYYQNLSVSALDIAQRYAEYSTYGETEALESSDEAPSNVQYFVENTTTKQRYTNMSVRTLTQAQNTVFDTGAAYVFEGERRLNVMVVNNDHVLSESAAQWFSERTLVGSNERVMIAVDLTYAVSDSLLQAEQDYQSRQPWLWIGLVVGAFSLLLLLLLLVRSVMHSGKAMPVDLVRDAQPGRANRNYVSAFDNIPTEIAAGICLIMVIIWWWLGTRLMNRLRRPDIDSLRRLAVLPAVCAVEYELLLFSLLSLVRRIKARTLRTNSVTYYVIMGSRQVLRARKRSQRMFILYAGFMILNMVFLMVGGMAGAIMMLTLNFAALLYLMREEVGNQTIYEGLKQFQSGQIDYRINTEVLSGESRDLGRAVNNMGDGLQKAVDTMLRSERLKAELITNVSHDLKTPLTSVINYVDLLKKEPAGSEKSARYLEILDQKTQRLKSLTEDLIELSKISSGSLELHFSAIDLRAFVLQAVGECGDRLEEAQLSMHLDASKDHAGRQIRADGEQLWRVFENLLGNMAKYAKPESDVYVALSVERSDTGEETAYICFTNEPAVPITASAEQLLERFSRGDASRTTPGSGLGLSIARSLTELMEGTFDLTVESSLFLVRVGFPVIKPDASGEKGH